MCQSDELVRSPSRWTEAGVLRGRSFARALLIGAFIALVSAAHAADVEPPVKLSATGICHERGGPFYVQTRNYTSYPTLNACLRAGGRLPRDGSGAEQRGASALPVEARSDVVRWAALGAGVLALAFLVWWLSRLHARRRAAAAAAEERRRWQDHRLSKFDRADEAKLLLAVGGDRATFERLVRREIARDPQMAREQAIADAYAQWKKDNGR